MDELDTTTTTTYNRLYYISHKAVLWNSRLRGGREVQCEVKKKPIRCSVQITDRYLMHVFAFLTMGCTCIFCMQSHSAWEQGISYWRDHGQSPPPWWICGRWCLLSNYMAYDGPHTL